MSCLSLAHVELSLCCPPLIHTLSTGYPNFRGRSPRLSRRALPRLCHIRFVAPQRCKFRCVFWHRHSHVHSIAGSQMSCVSLLLNDAQRHPLTAYTRYVQRDLEGKKALVRVPFLMYNGAWISVSGSFHCASAFRPDVTPASVRSRRCGRSGRSPRPAHRPAARPCRSRSSPSRTAGPRGRACCND